MNTTATIAETQPPEAPPPGPPRPRRRPPLRPGAQVINGPVGPAFSRPPNLLAYPYLSIAERDRRWDATRRVLDHLALDALIIPPSDPGLTLLHADARWLSQLGGVDDAPVAVVFPAIGEPIGIAQNAAQWLECQPWLSDVREAASDFAAAVRVVLRELPRRRRIGVARLDASGLDYDDGPSDVFFSSLVRSFPRAQWVDVSSSLDLLRFMKSAEEVAFVEQSATILDMAFVAAAAVVRPGASDAAPWAALVEAMCRAGSDIPPPPFWAAGPAPLQMQRRPNRQALAAGWTILTEAEAVWGGYRALGAQTYACGEPTPAACALMGRLAAGWEAGLRTLKTGILVPDVEAAMLNAIHRSTAESRNSSPIDWQLALGGCGLGGDLPRRGADQQADDRLALVSGCCLALTMSGMRDGRRVVWGDSVVITGTGARRLGRREAVLLADTASSAQRG